VVVGGGRGVSAGGAQNAGRGRRGDLGPRTRSEGAQTGAETLEGWLTIFGSRVYRLDLRKWLISKHSCPERQERVRLWAVGGVFPLGKIGLGQALMAGVASRPGRSRRGSRPRSPSRRRRQPTPTGTSTATPRRSISRLRSAIAKQCRCTLGLPRG
jgi:hypothetical protein